MDVVRWAAVVARRQCPKKTEPANGGFCGVHINWLRSARERDLEVFQATRQAALAAGRMILVNRARSRDAVQFFLDGAECCFSCVGVAICDRIEEVLGSILDDSLSPAVAGSTMIILTDLLLAGGGIRHRIISKQMAEPLKVGHGPESRSISGRVGEVNLLGRLALPAEAEGLFRPEKTLHAMALPLVLQ